MFAKIKPDGAILAGVGKGDRREAESGIRLAGKIDPGALRRELLPSDGHGQGTNGKAKLCDTAFEHFQT